MSPHFVSFKTLREMRMVALIIVAFQTLPIQFGRTLTAIDAFRHVWGRKDAA